MGIDLVQLAWLAPSLALIAWLYASVGLAGGSSYVALLASPLPLVPWTAALFLAACVARAGLAGAHSGARVFSLSNVQRLAALLIGLVGLRLVEAPP